MAEIKTRKTSDEINFVAKRRAENAAASALLDQDGLTQKTALQMLMTRLTDFNPTIFRLIINKATKLKNDEVVEK